MQEQQISQMPPKRQGSPDDFQTPASALEPLLPYLKKEWKIWECASGKGRLLDALREKGYEVMFSDILLGEGQDFIKSESALISALKEECNCIITNPPYTLKEEFIERCYQIGKPFALLMPLTALEGQKRQALYKKFGMQLILLNRRINFETPSGKGGGSWFATAWFTHKLNLPNDIIFGEVTKQRKPTFSSPTLKGGVSEGAV